MKTTMIVLRAIVEILVQIILLPFKLIFIPPVYLVLTIRGLCLGITLKEWIRETIVDNDQLKFNAAREIHWVKTGELLEYWDWYIEKYEA